MMEQNGDYDVCFVFPVDPRTNGFSEKAEEVMKKVFPRLGSENIFMYYSLDNSKIFVLLRLTIGRARFYADLHDFTVLANPEALDARAKLGWEADSQLKKPKINPLTIDRVERPDITRYGPFESIYLKYELEKPYEGLYQVHDNTGHEFSHVLVLKLFQQLLEEPPENHGLGLMMDELKKKPKEKGESPILLAAFPLHRENTLKKIKKDIFSTKCLFAWWHPFEDLKEYYGEKVGLYYKFTGHFQFWLALPAVVGLGFQLIVAGTSTVGHPAIPFFSLFIVIWGVLMLEFWKRNEKFTALQWGTIGCEENEKIRADFSDYESISLTGEEDLYFPVQKKTKLIAESFSILGILCACVIGTTSAIYVIRASLAKINKSGQTSSSIVASILNTIQIQIYGFLYSNLAEFLTDRENHKTDTQYEDSMIAKNFIFSFINSYASFFFIAFFASRVEKPMYPDQPPDENVGMCGYPDCMSTLSINLGIVLGTALVVSQIVGLIVPIVTYDQKKKKALKEAKSNFALSPAELQFLMSGYDFKSLIGDYMTTAILFGYMTLFISALPGAAFVTFLALWAESKSDAYRMTTLIQRPWPSSGEDIGTWQAIFDLVIAAAVITNAAMIVFTMPVLNKYDDFTRFWIFIGFQWVVFVSQFVIRALIPDEPLEVKIQQQRSEFFNAKIINREVDQDLIAVDMLDQDGHDKNWNPDDVIRNSYN